MLTEWVHCDKLPVFLGKLQREVKTIKWLCYLNIVFVFQMRASCFFEPWTCWYGLPVGVMDFMKPSLSPHSWLGTCFVYKLSSLCFSTLGNSSAQTSSRTTSEERKADFIWCCQVFWWWVREYLLLIFAWRILWIHCVNVNTLFCCQYKWILCCQLKTSDLMEELCHVENKVWQRNLSSEWRTRPQTINLFGC